MSLLPRKKLPIGIQTLAKIREGNFYYVDKTPFALELANAVGERVVILVDEYDKPILDNLHDSTAQSQW